MTNYTTGRLGYNSANDRYGLLVSDLWEIDGFHCGDALEILISKPDGSDPEWIPTRIEMDAKQNWYLVDTPFRGNHLECLKARIPKK